MNILPLPHLDALYERAVIKKMRGSQTNSLTAFSISRDFGRVTTANFLSVIMWVWLLFFAALDMVMRMNVAVIFLHSRKNLPPSF